MTPTRLQLQRWQSLTGEQRERVLALHISPEQIEFAGTTAQAVSVCEGASPDEVAAWVLEHWASCKTLALCVDDQNFAARLAYEVAGFSECAEPKAGRIGLVRYLSKSLKEAASA